MSKCVSAFCVTLSERIGSNSGLSVLLKDTLVSDQSQGLNHHPSDQ